MFPVKRFTKGLLLLLLLLLLFERAREREIGTCMTIQFIGYSISYP